MTVVCHDARCFYFTHIFMFSSLFYFSLWAVLLYIAVGGGYYYFTLMMQKGREVELDVGGTVKKSKRGDYVDQTAML